MKKIVHHANARREALTKFIQAHIIDVLSLCCRPDDLVEFVISDVKRDGSVRIKFNAADNLYTPITLCTGLMFRDVKTCTYDDVYAYVPLGDVPLSLEW